MQAEILESSGQSEPTASLSLLPGGCRTGTGPPTSAGALARPRPSPTPHLQRAHLGKAHTRNVNQEKAYQKAGMQELQAKVSIFCRLLIPSSRAQDLYGSECSKSHRRDTATSSQINYFFLLYDYYSIFPDSIVSEFELVFNKTL